MVLVKHWCFAAKLSCQHGKHERFMTCNAIWFGWMLPDWLNLNSYGYSLALVSLLWSSDSLEILELLAVHYTSLYCTLF